MRKTLGKSDDPEREAYLKHRSLVDELFNVKVVNLSTMQVRGKFRRQRTHQAGQSPSWKKAIVTLKEGDKIVLT